ncbi:hypothetical protein DXG01_009129 [Tephrocybe rancida]|nr:hypothetical protein DXG01_009129 [Tephrocybe rancida]
MAEGTGTISTATNGTIGLAFVASALKDHPTQHLILTIRNNSHSDASTAKLYVIPSKFPDPQYTIHALDLASLASMSAFASSMAYVTADGYEVSFQVNYLAYFVLVLSLLERSMGASSSDAHVPGGNAGEVFPPTLPGDIETLAKPKSDAPAGDVVYEKPKGTTALAVDPGTMPDSRATHQDAPATWSFDMKYILNPLQPVLKSEVRNADSAQVEDSGLVQLSLADKYRIASALSYYQGLESAKSPDSEGYDAAKASSLWDGSVTLWLKVTRGLGLSHTYSK